MNSQTTCDTRSPSTHSTQPSEAEIKKRAYEIFQRRGSRNGRDKEDWDQAVRELRAERQHSETRTLTPHSPNPKTSPASDSARAFSDTGTSEPASAKTSRKR